MLGWLIIVRTPGSDDQDDTVLAKWETGVSGIDWLFGLEREGKATCVSRHGYPTRFHVANEHVLPYLRAGHPPKHFGPDVIGDDYLAPGGWNGPMTVNAERLAACTGGAIWTVDAWDQS